MERSKGKEGSGIDAGPSMGSEGDNGSGGPFPDNTPWSGLGEEQDACGEGTEKHDDKDSNDEDNVDWEEGGSDEPEEPSEDVAPLPYQSVA
jgi:hypothetical protein